jgi:NitT/TauT family transport system substrate-binding protein
MNTMRPTWKVIALLLAAALLASCTGPAETKLPPLRVAYAQWWGDYTILIAKEKGFFDQFGVEVEPIYYKTSSRALPAIASGEIDAGTFTLGDTISIASHADMLAVAISDDGGASVVVAAPQIISVADLKGKQVGVLLGSVYEIVVDEMLKSGGLVRGDVTLLNIAPENIPGSLKTNRLQAGFTREPFTAQSTSQGNRILFASKDLSGLYANAIVFRQDVAAQRPEDVKNYLKAWFAAVNYRANHSQECNGIIAKALNISFNEVSGDAKLLTLENNLDLYSDQPNGFAKSIYALAQINSDFLVRNGSLNKIPDLRQLFVKTYLGSN